MARSIHTTYHEYCNEWKRYSYANQEYKKSMLKKLGKELMKKSIIKKQVRQYRKYKNIDLSFTQICDFPIRILEQGEYIHYPATILDIKEIISQLPKSICYGLSSVELTLGLRRKNNDLDEEVKKDPYTGRYGYEMGPGIFEGKVLGVYNIKKASIKLFAYVYSEEIINKEICELYLKICMLSTLVHEIAHHFDENSRVGRGRWLADEKDKVEGYAEEIESQWTKEYVYRYIKNAYPREFERFMSFLNTNASKVKSNNENVSILEIIKAGSCFEKNSV